MAVLSNAFPPLFMLSEWRYVDPWYHGGDVLLTDSPCHFEKKKRLALIYLQEVSKNKPP
jgi:hypothetical protein